MKRGRNDASHFQHYGPAAAALRRGFVFRDTREAKKQIKVQDILRDAIEMHRFHSAAATGPQTVGETRDESLGSSSSSQALLLHSREELALYRQKKRIEMEAKVTRGRQAVGNWVKYARWESEQQNHARMRSVMERALAIHGLEANLWRDYAELEAANGFVEEARQVFSRAVKLLPASVDLWLKYALLEFTAGSERRVREVFMKWTQTESVDPPALAFELQVLLEVAIRPPLIRCVGEGREKRFPDAKETNHENSSLTAPSSTALVPLSSPSSSSASSSLALAVPTGGLHFTVPSGEREPLSEVCRKILRRLVEVRNTTDSWLFYALVESIVLLDTERGIKVLHTAMQVLPSAVLYGPVECRIPLALADACCRIGDIAGARQAYHELLMKVMDQKHTDMVLQQYRRFERLHATTVEDGENAAFLQAKEKYERMLSRFSRTGGAIALLMNGTVEVHEEKEDAKERQRKRQKKEKNRKKGEEKKIKMKEEEEEEEEVSTSETNTPETFDYDAALSLYVLLTQHQQHIQQGYQSRTEGEDLEKNWYANKPLRMEEAQALEVLRQAVAALPSPTQFVRSQQHAALVSALANVVLQQHRSHPDKTHGMHPTTARIPEQVAQEARAALARTIQQFPFHAASGTALWLDAAMLEEEVFHNEDQARRLLQAGFEVTKAMVVLQALLDFECRAFSRANAMAQAEEEMGVDTKKEDVRKEEIDRLTTEYLLRMRKAFQSGIKAAPLDASRWHLYAKWEEQQAFFPSSFLSKEFLLNQNHCARAAILYRHCVSTITTEASKLSLSLSERYTLLQSVDATWAKLISLERRALRKSLKELQRFIASNTIETTAASTTMKADLFPSSSTSTSATALPLSSPLLPLQEVVRRNADTLHQVCLELLQNVAGGYHLEALAWALSYQTKGGSGVLSSFPPISLPDSLKPAIFRWAEACDAVVQCLSQEVAHALVLCSPLSSRNTYIHSAPTSGIVPSFANPVEHNLDVEMSKQLIRETFQSLLQRERGELYRALIAGKEGSFEEIKMAKTWREALLGPILTEWAKYESVVGGDLSAVSTAAASGLADGAIPPTGSTTAPKRRGRLFQKA